VVSICVQDDAEDATAGALARGIDLLFAGWPNSEAIAMDAGRESYGYQGTVHWFDYHQADGSRIMCPA